MDKAQIKKHALAIATYLQSVEPVDYSRPFQSLYAKSQSQLLAAVKHFRDMRIGGKALNKLAQGLTLEEGQMLAEQRLVQQVIDTLYFLNPQAKTGLMRALPQPI